jgi:hypothetical protein
MDRPFMRDVIFYIGAAYWTFYIFYKGVVTTWEAIGWSKNLFEDAFVYLPLSCRFYCALYVAYITVVHAEKGWPKFPKHN